MGLFNSRRKTEENTSGHVQVSRVMYVVDDQDVQEHILTGSKFAGEDFAQDIVDQLPHGSSLLLEVKDFLVPTDDYHAGDFSKASACAPRIMIERGPGGEDYGADAETQRIFWTHVVTNQKDKQF